MNDIIIRQATEKDATIVAKCVLAAMEILDIDSSIPINMEKPFKNLKEATLDTTRLYSCKNSLIAEVNGDAVGCLISYCGDDYATLRKRTFDILYEESGLDLRNNPMETGPGEYYLDCMAIKSKFRGKGIGHLLMKKAIENGKILCYKHFTLLVEKSHNRLQEYYAQLGFSLIEKIVAFGSEYTKMEYKL
ncbi:MAG: GNAT family N-acetyltransferase [Bacteroidales bacterium]|nr:GNAT family N-acetyltransferase [Bacteroidales bacterium]